MVLGKSIIGAIYQGGKFHAVRHAADRARAVLLRHRTGRLRRAQGVESGVLRAGRRAHADAGEHILRARLGGVYGRELAAGFAKVAVASAAMGAAIFLSSRGMEGWLGVSQMARRADLVVSIPLGLAVFYVACKVMGVTDLDMAVRAVMAPVKRRFHRKNINGR
jgi:hypothetical protein